MKLTWADVTPKSVWLNRRAFIVGAAALGGVPALAARPASGAADLTPSPIEDITGYNNYYEFGTGKEDPARNAGTLTTQPWTVRIDGLVDRPGSYSVADLAPERALEERIYKLRCVEAWSLVIPWLGVPLGPVLDRAGVQPSAKWVHFQTLLRPEEMPMQQTGMMDWPYVEGLRLDEAMHPLTILATGLYGQPLPNQNGAPIRLVVPWKYGFKSIKSIVRISLVAERPNTSWNDLQPSEYGFFANVNPKVDHPRWSQATERRVGAGLFAGREPTQMFNGYADQVASLYTGMDLARDY